MAPHKEMDRQSTAIHILLVDDCDVNQFVAQQYLERSGYRVDIAQSGHQAIEAHKQQPYDLILMDLVMPGMDGYEAAKRIRKAEWRMWNGETKESDIKSEMPDPDHKCACNGNNNPAQTHSCSEKDCKCKRAGAHQDVNSAFRIPHSAFEAVPIIGITGHNPDSVMDLCLQAGMNDCIGKPLQFESLVSIVRKWSTGALAPEPGITVEDDSKQLNPDMTEHQAPIDLTKTIAEFLGKKDILLEVIKTFQIRVRAQIMQIKQYLSATDYNPIFAEAHAIKGGAANLGAFQLSQAAARLEEAAGEASSDKAMAAAHDLEKEFHRLNDYLDQSEIGKAV
jgi:CheY-like chemotaxis protein